jgi:hypothetical protein
MNIINDIDTEPELLLDEIGGEELNGSGFENEIPDSDFIEPESFSEGEER